MEHGEAGFLVRQCIQRLLVQVLQRLCVCGEVLEQCLEVVHIERVFERERAQRV